MQIAVWPDSPKDYELVDRLPAFLDPSLETPRTLLEPGKDVSDSLHPLVDTPIDAGSAHPEDHQENDSNERTNRSKQHPNPTGELSPFHGMAGRHFRQRRIPSTPGSVDLT